jgi:hypothetical protein
MPALDPFHSRVAGIALTVAEQHGYALGGGLALVAHGVLQRPTEDVDLFSDRAGNAVAAADLVRSALEAAGIEVEEAEGDALDGVIEGFDGHLVELTAYRDAEDHEGVRVSLGHLHRAHRPVRLDIGPVLHLDDLCAWKVAALVARAEPRDLIDVSAFLLRYPPAELVAMAREVDPAIEDDEVRAVGARLDGLKDQHLARYGLDAAAIGELRRRFATWPR